MPYSYLILRTLVRQQQKIFDLRAKFLNTNKIERMYRKRINKKFPYPEIVWEYTDIDIGIFILFYFLKYCEAIFVA